jgi:hypothetical protein
MTRAYPDKLKRTETRRDDKVLGMLARAGEDEDRGMRTTALTNADRENNCDRGF